MNTTTTTTNEGTTMTLELTPLKNTDFSALLERHGLDPKDRLVDLLWDYATDFRSVAKDIASAMQDMAQCGTKTVHELNNGLRANNLGWAIHAARRLPDYEKTYEMLLSMISKVTWAIAANVPDDDAFRADVQELIYGTKAQ